MKQSVLKFTTVLSCFLFLACNKPTSESSFYYWKTKFHLSQTEKNSLLELKTKLLYVRFFDVDVPEGSSQPLPIAILEGIDSIPKNINVIPVIFITNRTFLNLNKDEVLVLAKNVVSKINSIKTSYDELQFDCDWSGKTRENYFLFLEEVKNLISKEVKLSCTIRLHQVKYTFKTGVPPVSKGVLMFYNMGNLTDINGENSIYDQKIAEKYTSYLQTYKLPLDVALPIFKWYVHYRNNNVIGLITKNNSPKINDTIHFSQQENNTKFNVRVDYIENGVFYKVGDVLKFESISKEQLIEAAELLKQNIKKESRKIIFYDLDENNLNYYDKEVFTKVITTLN